MMNEYSNCVAPIGLSALREFGQITPRKLRGMLARLVHLAIEIKTGWVDFSF